MEICNKQDCTGCQACMQGCPTHAISMQESIKGHIYPVIDSNICINCHKCIRICPVLNKVNKYQPLNILAGWNNNKKERKDSTSGGVSYLLSKKIIEEGGYFCGSIWESTGAKHIVTNDINKISLFQGSKYTHSNINNCFIKIQQLLKNNQIVLFSGTPCQVAGLKSYLKQDFNNLYTLDIVCHGVPSHKALSDRIKYIEKKYNKKIKEIRFRDKNPDQYHTCMKYIFSDDSYTKCSVYEDSYFCGFVDNYLLRENCFHCKYATRERVSDITLADYWGYSPYNFKFKSYQKGTSFISINTAKGQNLYSKIQHQLIAEPRTFEDAAKGNKNLHNPQTRPINYDKFWDSYTQGANFEELALCYFPPKKIQSTTNTTIRNYIKMLLPNFVTTYIKKKKL